MCYCAACVVLLCVCICVCVFVHVRCAAWVCGTCVIVQCVHVVCYCVMLPWGVIASPMWCVIVGLCVCVCVVVCLDMKAGGKERFGGRGGSALGRVIGRTFPCLEPLGLKYSGGGPVTGQTRAGLLGQAVISQTEFLLFISYT